MAVKFFNDTKLYVVREFAVMRDGRKICKLSDIDGFVFWSDINELEVFTDEKTDKYND